MQTANDGSIECWSAYKVENQVCLGQIVRFVWVKNSRLFGSTFSGVDHKFHNGHPHLFKTKTVLTVHNKQHAANTSRFQCIWSMLLVVNSQYCCGLVEV